MKVALNFLRDFAKVADLSERGLALGAKDTRTVVDLLTEQVEFADVVMLKKCDLVEAEKLGKLEGIQRKRNPRAKIVRAPRSRVPLEEVPNTERFDFEEAAQSTAHAHGHVRERNAALAH